MFTFPDPGDQPKKKRYITRQYTCRICGAVFERACQASAVPQTCGKDCLAVLRTGKVHEKYVIPERWHEIIRKTYLDATGKDGAIKRLAAQIGVPRTRLTNYARKHGWINRRRCTDYNRPWDPEEIKILHKYAHTSPLTTQRKLEKAGFKRTVSAVEVKRARERVVQNRKGVSANDLALCMGIDSHSILKLINTGKLKAKRLEGYNDSRTLGYHILPSAVRKYITENLAEVNIAKCDKYWLIDLFTTNDKY